MNLDEALVVLEANEEMDFLDIRRSYRDLVDVLHPDMYTHNQRLYDKASERLKEINCAYNIIQKHYKNSTDSRTKKHNNSKEQKNRTNQESYSENVTAN